MSIKRIDLLICCGSGCVSAGALRIKEKFIEVLNKNNIYDEVNIIETGCMGPCDFGPVLMVYPEGIFYTKVSPDDAEEIVNEHFIKGRPVKRLMQQEKDSTLATKEEIPFYKKQIKVALENCGYLNPERIEEYIALGGYEALVNVLNGKPEDAIETIKRSGLRGRGGAGFPVGMKWEFVNKAQGSPKYVVCNADEGDPGAFMDRAVLEGDPYSIIEAMAIAGYAIGSSQGYIYVRAEYPLAVERINFAIQEAYKNGVLGSNIFKTDFSFFLETRLGAGAFVCGEETALIASIEGERGMPRNKPPFPAVSGLWKKPTIINNVETLANIPVIINRGAEWFTKIGTEASKGTKVFALGGKIANTGLLEIPMGTTLRDVIYGIGGGIPNGKKFKAVQTGGPSGGCLTANDLDTPIDYDNLIALGSMMGSGGMIVMDEDNCMVDVARFFLEFTVEESCGKCTPCREGTKRMLEILQKITKGEGCLEDLDELEELAYSIKDSALCGLGQTAPNPVLSTLKNFYNEYYSHVVDKKCPAGVCRDLIKYVITDACIGCGKCKRNCPVDAISGNTRQKHIIDQNLCIRCGACKMACSFHAIITE